MPKYSKKQHTHNTNADRLRISNWLMNNRDKIDGLTLSSIGVMLKEQLGYTLTEYRIESHINDIRKVFDITINVKEKQPHSNLALIWDAVKEIEHRISNIEQQLGISKPEPRRDSYERSGNAAAPPK